MAYSLEQVFEIWDDEAGDKFEVGDDRDGTETTEIRYRDARGQVGDRLQIPDKALPLVIDALNLRLSEIIRRQSERPVTVAPSEKTTETFFEIKPEHVGKGYTQAFDRTWQVACFIGRIFASDVGKYVFLRGDVLQVESDEQRARRLATALKDGGT